MKELNEVQAGRYLCGEMTGMEKENFEKTMASDTEAMERFIVFKRIWLQSSQDIQQEWDTDGAWTRFQDNLNSSQPATVRRKLLIRYWPVAATFLLLLGLSLLYFSAARPVTYTFQEGMASPIALKDGSKVYLNQSSSIKVYPFTRKKRRVELQGEAYFEVSPDASRPFTITSGKTITEVVGTSFNIRQSGTSTTIFVHKGKVIFSSLEDKKAAIALTAGEAAVFENQRIQPIPNPSPNANAWFTRQLRFVNMPLTDVIADISAYFGQEIIIENKDVTSCRISIPRPFKQPEINTVLSALVVSINAQLVKEGGRYIIRGGRCF